MQKRRRQETDQACSTARCLCRPTSCCPGGRPCPDAVAPPPLLLRPPRTSPTCPPTSQRRPNPLRCPCLTAKSGRKTKRKTGVWVRKSSCPAGSGRGGWRSRGGRRKQRRRGRAGGLSGRTKSEAWSVGTEVGRTQPSWMMQGLLEMGVGLSRTMCGSVRPCSRLADRRLRRKKRGKTPDWALTHVWVPRLKSGDLDSALSLLPTHPHYGQASQAAPRPAGGQERRQEETRRQGSREKLVQPKGIARLLAPRLRTLPPN